MKTDVQEEPQMSNAKKTLLYLLGEQINQLQDGVRGMKQQDLIKNVAKRKVVYNISKQGLVQLIYAQIALTDYYITHNMLDSAQRVANQSRDLQIIGDSSYMLANILLKKSLKKESAILFQQCLLQQWIEPSVEHKIAAKLQAMTNLQQIYFQIGEKDKLIQLSYDKIKLTKQSQSKRSENYFHALSLADMGIIHEAFGEYQLALEKIQGAISIYSILQSCGQQPSKQIQLLKIEASIVSKMGKIKGQSSTLEKALNILNTYPGCIDQRSQVQLLEKYIESNLLN